MEKNYISFQQKMQDINVLPHWRFLPSISFGSNLKPQKICLSPLWRFFEICTTWMSDKNGPKPHKNKG